MKRIKDSDVGRVTSRLAVRNRKSVDFVVVMNNTQVPSVPTRAVKHPPKKPVLLEKARQMGAPNIMLQEG